MSVIIMISCKLRAVAKMFGPSVFLCVCVVVVIDVVIYM